MFDVNAHSGKELHQFKLCGIQLILTVLGNDNLVDKVFAYVLTGTVCMGLCGFYVFLLNLLFLVSVFQDENISEEKDNNDENFYLR